ncbi:unnamed protein product [Ambrosiozyma monospora]|uniref:Unnamed protein product n=1 Tax=Ambrosiozyma monospora TaxID=43982 RepID=A0A9W7DGF4_AMBMO|nr:unnamed protein product [Ambrosiozyma monospora]
MTEINQLLHISDVNEALTRISSCVAPLDSLALMTIIEDQLDSADKPTRSSMFALIECYCTKFPTHDDLDLLLVSLQEFGEVTNIYQYLCYVKMAKAARANGDSSDASNLLTKVNPLKLSTMPLTAAEYYVLKAQLANDPSQRERSLSKGLEIITTKFTGNPSSFCYTILHLIFEVKFAFASYLAQTKTKLGTALELSFENLEFGLKSTSDGVLKLQSSPEFKENFDILVALLIVVPYSHTKIHYLSKFHKYISFENPWVMQNIEPSAKSLLLSFINYSIIRFDDKELFGKLEAKFGLDVNVVYDQLIEFDLICISKIFTSIQLKDIIRTLALPETYSEEQVIDLVFRLVMDKKINAELDDITGFVYFKEEEKAQDWNSQIVDFLDTVDYITDKIQAY